MNVPGPTVSRAAVFTAPGEPLVEQSFPLPRLAPDELLVRITCCTLCGSDVSTFLGKRATPLPTVLGHEILGEIIAFGPEHARADWNAAPLAVGDRITWSVAASCGACFYCNSGLPQKCVRLFKYGHECCQTAHPLSGGLAEYCHLAAGTAVVRVPDALPDAVACPANCATATVAAALRLAGECRGASVLIQGAGMLGLTAAAMAASHGAGSVLVCDIDRQRLAQATQFGATHTIDASLPAAAVLATLRELTEGRGIDLAIELSGAAEAMELGLAALRVGGRYVWAGAVRPTRSLAVDPEHVVRRMLSIQGLHNYAPRDLAAAVSFLQAQYRRFPFDELVAARFPLAAAQAAFEHAIAERAVRVAVSPA